MKYVEFSGRQVSTNSRITIYFIDSELDGFIHGKENHLVYCKTADEKTSLQIEKSDIEVFSAKVSESKTYY